jgi:predicted methyltransferase
MIACLVKNQNFGFFNIDIKTPISKKAFKALFKLKSDFLVHNPEDKTSIHVFDHTIKPILLYGCEIWGYFNPFTSRFRNGNIPID